MRRMISVLAVMAIMAALVAASAMPAFAKVKGTSYGDCENGTCSNGDTSVGGSKYSEFHGKRTSDSTYNQITGDFFVSGNDQGGGKGIGGGNCTFTQDGNFVNEVINDPVIGGNGSRCNQQ